MNELHKELIVIFVLSEVLSAIIFTVSLYSGRSAEGMIFLLFGINLAVIGLNNGITILLVRHHVRNYMDQMNKVRMEAEHDRLTGLYNRNGFERRAEEFLEKECPGGALLLLDLDNFKQINDREGHPEGDRVLQIFARCLTDSFRKEDLIGRLGGDEFAILLGNPVPERILAGKITGLRTEIRSRLSGRYGKYQLSASIGAVPVDGRIRDYRKLYRCADAALYISKYRGKDRFYINEKMIDCMRRECIGCRTECPRSGIIKARPGKDGEQ